MGLKLNIITIWHQQLQAYTNCKMPVIHPRWQDHVNFDQLQTKLYYTRMVPDIIAALAILSGIQAKWPSVTAEGLASLTQYSASSTSYGMYTSTNAVSSLSFIFSIKLHGNILICGMTSYAKLCIFYLTTIKSITAKAPNQCCCHEIVPARCFHSHPPIWCDWPSLRPTAYMGHIQGTD